MKTSIFFVLLLAIPAAADEPEIYIDKGACPGERCTYCTLYVAKSDIVLRKNPSMEAEEAGIIKAGDALVARNGEVHVVPAKFNVYKDFNQFKAGDEVYLLTYLGEGYFKIRHNTVESQGDFGFSPWGGSWDGECDDPDACVGGLDDGYEWTWWLYVTTEKGMYGWIPESDELQYTDPT
jgi:hypothetical protein